jgi:Ca2+-binding EF-hand superfamily protein
MKNQKQETDDLDLLLAEYMAQPVTTKVLESEVDFLSEFKIHKPFLSRSAIEAASRYFTETDKIGKGWISVEEIRALLPRVFATDHQLTPKMDSVNTLFKKIGLEENHKITQLIFRRFLKELSGYKNYSSISILLPKTSKQPQLAQNKARPNVRINFQAINAKTESFEGVTQTIDNSSRDKTSFSVKALETANELFKKADIRRKGTLPLCDIESSISKVFQIDDLPCPRKSLINEVFEILHYKSDTQISKDDFLSLIHQLKSHSSSRKNIREQNNTKSVTNSPYNNELLIEKSEINKLISNQQNGAKQIKYSNHPNISDINNYKTEINFSQKNAQEKSPSIIANKNEIQGYRQQTLPVNLTHRSPTPKKSSIADIFNPKESKKPIVPLYIKSESYKLAHSRSMTPKIARTPKSEVKPKSGYIISEKTMKEVKKTFKLQDLDTDGKIRLDLLDPVFAEISVSQKLPPLSSQEIAELIQAYGLDPKAKVNWRSFKNLLKRMSDPARFENRSNSCIKSLF